MGRFMTSRFTFVRSSGPLVAEMSSLGNRPFHQVYPDACDEGLTIVSSRTGNEVDFVVSHVEYNGDDLAAWHLIPASQQKYLPREVANLKVVIFND